MNPQDRARRLIGVPYRPYGRDPRTGLDCLGLALACFDVGEDRRNGGDGRFVDERAMARSLSQHFIEVSEPQTGDLVVMRRGRRWHFAISDAETLIHADARARRVIRRRGDPPWPVVSRWRMKGK